MTELSPSFSAVQQGGLEHLEQASAYLCIKKGWEITDASVSWLSTSAFAKSRVSIAL